MSLGNGKKSLVGSEEIFAESIGTYQSRKS